VVSDERARLRDLVRKAVNRVHTRGVSEVASLALTRAAQALWSRSELIVLVRAASGEAPGLDGYDLRLATGDDAERYARDIGTDSAETFRARLSEHSGCFIVVAGDRIVHATWWTVTGAWTRELGAHLVPTPGDAYVYESFTGPGERGRGIYPFALRGISVQLGALGVARVWVAVEKDNLASLRAVSKAGFEAAAEISYTRRLGRVTVASPRRLGERAPVLPEITSRQRRHGQASGVHPRSER
jgi:L-amino acid N-acyltransferase YncA